MQAERQATNDIAERLLTMLRIYEAEHGPVEPASADYARHSYGSEEQHIGRIKRVLLDNGWLVE
ncbi:MAG TPA: hypothetical protein VFA07_19790 [Chthonomonadaceae bacterium]|nr:hypothetical protein [Chthonomonadaceae bacterium]